MTKVLWNKPNQTECVRARQENRDKARRSNRNVYDHKQQQLIQRWIEFADREDLDAYSQFIALWIAFNAACYGRYFKAAIRRCANLSKGKGLDKVPSEPTPVNGTIVRERDRFKLELSDPGRIVITISERYTEDRIFQKFASEFREEYKAALRCSDFRESVNELRESLRKNGDFYVLNMARAEDYNMDGNLDDLITRKVVVPFIDMTELEQVKNVLYQIRCNTFHGEKVPGDVNDDRIVKCAIPVLSGLLKFLFPGCG